MTRPDASLARVPLVLAVSSCFAFCSPAEAQIPPGYYDSVDASNPAALRQTLHEVIDDHTKLPYTSSSTDTWDVLELAEEDPSDPSRIIDVYKNASYPKQGGGNSFYDREHSWPKSYGFPDDGPANLPFSDCHLLFLCDGAYNAARSNKPFKNCPSGCQEYPTQPNNGQGGQGGGYPGDSNWTSGAFTQGAWETWIGKRGDVARAMFYADVRYEGGIHSVLGASEPDLILTDNVSLIDQSNTGNNESVAYMGILSVLLQWHVQDPVDDWERHKNDVVFQFQGNRNPFVDHPEWVDCLFSSVCGQDTTPPAVPVGLQASAGNGFVILDWTDNSEPDLAGYRVYRSQGGPFVEIGGGVVGVSTYADVTVTNGVTYTYQVTAEDVSGNESAPSAGVQATPGGGGALPKPWINELHYDNTGSDTGEFVEVAGAAGIDLGGYSLVGYNGNGGGSYKTVNLAGTIPDQQNGFGTLSFPFSSLQNGAPDGVALVDPSAAVIEFLSYEGSFQATDGPAQGMTSTDIGVSESSSTPVGFSLQLGGSGEKAQDFTWQAELADTPGQVNQNQTFGAIDQTPPAAPAQLVANATSASVSLDWADNTEPDLLGYDVYRATVSGGPYAKLTASPQPGSDFTDNQVIAGVTYFYVVTASDQSGNESASSAEVSATPEVCQADLGFGSHPTATMSVCGGDLGSGHDAQFLLDGLPAGAQVLLFVGLTANPTPIFELGGASLVPVPPLFTLVLPNPGSGSLALPVTGGGGPVSIYLQGVIVSGSAADTTNALRLDILP